MTCFQCFFSNVLITISFCTTGHAGKMLPVVQKLDFVVYQCENKRKRLLPSSTTASCRFAPNWNINSRSATSNWQWTRLALSG